MFGVFQTVAKLFKTYRSLFVGFYHINCKDASGSLARCQVQCSAFPRSNLCLVIYVRNLSIVPTGLKINRRKAQWCFFNGRQACGGTGHRLQGARESPAGCTRTTKVQKTLSYLIHHAYNNKLPIALQTKLNELLSVNLLSCGSHFPTVPFRITGQT